MPTYYFQVLDIAGPAPQPTQYVSLVLRRPDKRRKSTQTWHFTEDGHLCCAHNNMCVQAKDGFFGLHRGKHVLSFWTGTRPGLCLVWALVSSNWI